MRGKRQAKQILIGPDRLASAIIAGSADETLSARAYRLSRDRGRHWPRRVIDTLLFWDENHCEQGSIDCEINHPKFGWIPFTVSENDPEEFGRQIAFSILAGEAGPIALYVGQKSFLQSVPSEVSRFQARTALYIHGLLDQVEEYMANLTTNTITRLAWQDAQVFKRESPTVLALGSLLGLNSDQLDSLFIEASQIQA